MLTLLSLLPLVAPLAEEQAVPAREAAPAPRLLELHVEPLSDLWMWLRSAPAEEPAPPGAEACYAAAREAQRALAHPLAWGPVEGHLAHARTAAELVERLADLPEELSLGPRRVPLRAPAGALARAFAECEPSLRAALWEPHRARLEAAAQALRARFAPHEPELVRLLGEQLAFAPPAAPVPVHLVERAPEPGAVTHRSGPRDGVCFVGLEGFEALGEDQLAEAVLHESLHALDVRSEEDVLDELRRAMQAAGIDARSSALRDLPHALIFVEAAELVRRTLDPAHEDYGRRAGAYERMGPLAEQARALWLRHLAGELEREATLAALVELARASTPR